MEAANSGSANLNRMGAAAWARGSFPDSGQAPEATSFCSDLGIGLRGDHDPIALVVLMFGIGAISWLALSM
jgi:hypothetical protein